jgi:hypothetical protein
MKKLLLMFFVAIGATNGIFAMENSDQTADDLAIDNCIDLLKVDPDRQNISYLDKLSIFRQQLDSLAYLKDRVKSTDELNLEEKKMLCNKFKKQGIDIHHNINLLRKSGVFVKEVSRKTMQIHAPKFSTEAQKTYAHGLNRCEQWQTCELDRLIGQYEKWQEKRYSRYKEILEALNVSKKRVQDTFGQDIFLAPNDDLNVQRMMTNYIILEDFINRSKILKMRVDEDFENKSKLVADKVNSFKKPEYREKYFKVFRREKLRNMSSVNIAQEIRKDKMNRE